MAEKEIKLKVAEAIQEDVNKGIVRIESSMMKEIEVKPGDFVEIEGERKTVGIVDRGYPGDIGLAWIRMDGIVRRNAKTSISEIVRVRKADVKEAKKVIVAPTTKGVYVRASPGAFKQGLLGRVVLKGDIVSLGGTGRRRTTMIDSPFFQDIFKMMDDGGFGGFGFGDIRFVVVSTNPAKGAVIISDATEITLNPEAVEVKEEAILEVTYEDVGGLNEEITKIREMVELPLKHPEVFRRLGIEAPKGVLLHGPPGTGKTLLAKAVANESSSHFILINGPEIMSKFYGQSEENLRKKFEEAEKNAPAIIFIDEIDSLAPKREEVKGEVERRVVAQLLALMDGLKSRGKVVVIAATNVPNILDPALRRPGRFDREVEIGVPGKEGRLNILKIHTRNMPLDNWDSEVAARCLLDQINKVKEKNEKEIVESEQQIKDKNSENNELQKELKRLYKELEESKKEKEKVTNDSLLTKILYKIRILQSNFDQIKSKIEKIEESIKTKDKEIKKLKEDCIKLKKLHETLGEKKELVGEKLKLIVEDIKETKRLSGLREEKDSRKTFYEMYLENKKGEVKEYEKDLFEMGIISPDYFERVRKNSIEQMLKDIAEITYGFVGADLAALCREAAMDVIRKVLPEIRLQEDEEIPEATLKKIQIMKEDFINALRVVRPSALREVLIETPNVKWEDIGGLEDVKQEIVEAVEWPLKYPNEFKRMGVRPPRGIFIYGAPGTGKTLLAKAVAHESKANFISVKGPELLSKWINETPQIIKKLFEKARQVSPSIIFFDEIDSIASKRELSGSSYHSGMMAIESLLTQLDGLEDLHDVVVIAATNRPDMVDTALLRPGRFDRIVLTPVPDRKGREKIFEVHTKNMPLKDVDIKKLAEKTEGYVGADIEAICREAAMLALRENIKSEEITTKHFEDALKKVGPSVTKDIEKAYEDLKSTFKATRAKEMKERPSYMG